MEDSKSIESINIRPGVSILSVLKHLNYKPWYALAEFVDNALQSYIDHKDELRRLEGPGYQLKVSIKIESGENSKITITDNAAGIYHNDYARAFRPASLPPDTSGLSEFGMGMKSASCWFAEKFTVRTGALGENVAREVCFDVNKIIKDSIEELSIKTDPKDENIHFTVIVLENLHKPLQGKTINKIEDHLTSIYREYFRNNTLDLEIDGHSLIYTEPKILNAPYFKSDSGPKIEWKKQINFDFGNGLGVTGFAALLETASVSNAGFSLFRNKRVIQGSLDDSYRPEYIFKKSNSFIYQRLFGELHLEGFDVSHTKDGFRWEDNEETFLQLLEEHLDSEPLPLLKQAEGHRVRPKIEDLQKTAANATRSTADVIEKEVPKVIESQLNASIDNTPPPNKLTDVLESSKRIVKFTIDNKEWEITQELSIDPSIKDWIEISDSKNITNNKIGIRMSLMHPFMVQFAGSDLDKVEPLWRVAIAIILSEITAGQSGLRGVATIRRNINQYLREALSKP